MPTPDCSPTYSQYAPPDGARSVPQTNRPAEPSIKSRHMASPLPADPTNDALSYEASYLYRKEVYEEMCALYVKSWENL